jgi:hypothetical protein
MDILSVIVVLCIAAAPLALLSRWFVDRGYRGLGSLVNPGDSSNWWRATMPWPQGVQEEDGVAWHIREPEPGVVGSPAADPASSGLAGRAFMIAPVRAAKVHLNASPSERPGPRR